MGAGENMVCVDDDATSAGEGQLVAGDLDLREAERPVGGTGQLGNGRGIQYIVVEADLVDCAGQETGARLQAPHPERWRAGA